MAPLTEANIKRIEIEQNKTKQNLYKLNSIQIGQTMGILIHNPS